ncbi:MAG: hypothetical protein ABI664_10490 [bacterium]
MRKLEYFEEELNASPLGREMLGVIRSHMDEVTSLINGNRAVMIAWQRNHGPRFLTLAMDSGFDASTPVRKEIDGVRLQQLLLRMADALQQSGSRALAATIARYASPVMTAATDCDTLRGLFDRIRRGTLAVSTR